MMGPEAGIGHTLADFESFSLKSGNPMDSLHALQYAMIVRFTNILAALCHLPLTSISTGGLDKCSTCGRQPSPK